VILHGVSEITGDGGDAPFIVPAGDKFVLKVKPW